MPTPTKASHDASHATSDDDDTPAALRPHLADYWVLQGRSGRDTYIPRVLNEDLRQWEQRRSVGVPLLWPHAVSHGISKKMAFDAVCAALARRGRRNRFTVETHHDGESYIVTKVPGQRPPPATLRRELTALNAAKRTASDIETVFLLQQARERLAAKLRKPLRYEKPGRRKAPSPYDFDDWRPGEWRVFPSSVTSEQLRWAFANFCKVRDITGRLEILPLADGRLAALRHGQFERPYPAAAKPVDEAVVTVPQVMMQADRQALWVPEFGRDERLGASYTHHERIRVVEEDTATNG